MFKAGLPLPVSGLASLCLPYYRDFVINMRYYVESKSTTELMQDCFLRQNSMQGCSIGLFISFFHIQSSGLVLKSALGVLGECFRHVFVQRV